MPAIDQFVTVAVSAPGWAWVAVAVLLAAVALADDRLGKMQAGASAFRSLSRDVQILAVTGLAGFVVGWVYPPTQLAAMAGGAI